MHIVKFRRCCQWPSGDLVGFAVSTTVCERANSLAQEERREHGKPALSYHLMNKYLSTRSGARPRAKSRNHADEWALVFVLEDSAWLSRRADTEAHRFLTS